MVSSRKRFSAGPERRASAQVDEETATGLTKPSRNRPVWRKIIIMANI